MKLPFCGAPAFLWQIFSLVYGRHLQHQQHRSKCNRAPYSRVWRKGISCNSFFFLFLFFFGNPFYPPSYWPIIADKKDSHFDPCVCAHTLNGDIGTLSTPPPLHATAERKLEIKRKSPKYLPPPVTHPLTLSFGDAQVTKKKRRRRRRDDFILYFVRFSFVRRGGGVGWRGLREFPPIVLTVLEMLFCSFGTE